MQRKQQGFLVKNECLRLIGSQMKVEKKQEKICIVVEQVDGRAVETRLPKEQAQRLYRKLRAAGANANIFYEAQNEVEGTKWKEMPYITGFEPEA